MRGAGSVSAGRAAGGVLLGDGRCVPFKKAEKLDGDVQAIHFFLFIASNSPVALTPRSARPSVAAHMSMRRMSASPLLDREESRVCVFVCCTYFAYATTQILVSYPQ